MLTVNVKSGRLSQMESPEQQKPKRGRPLGPTSQTIKRRQAIKKWRSQGMPWWKIGEQLGMTKQGAHQIIQRDEAERLPEEC